LWEIWHAPDGGILNSCTILTTAANSLVAPVHERMPVILSAVAAGQWLGPGSPQVWQDLLKPYPAEQMAAHQVSSLVNSPHKEGPELVIPYAG